MMPKVLASSADPTKVALTIKGMLVAVIPILIIIGQHYGFTVTETSLMELIENFTGILSAIMIGYGLLRKIILSKHKPTA